MNDGTVIHDADMVVVNNRIAAIGRRGAVAVPVAPRGFIAASTALATKPNETLFGYVKAFKIPQRALSTAPSDRPRPAAKHSDPLDKLKEPLWRAYRIRNPQLRRAA